MNPEDTNEGPTNLADLMAELIPPPEPEPISLLPQTLGWPLLAIILIVAVVVFGRRYVKARRAEAYRAAALTALDEAGSASLAVATVLRQTALAAYPRSQVAGLYGQDWLEFLKATSNDSRFLGDAGQALVTAPYAGSAALPDATLGLVRHWIRRHDRSALS
ncbi:MAG: DUF4381 domain-containing protein [Pseudomonadota bacterium]